MSAMPHDFSKLGTDRPVPNGVYYQLKPEGEHIGIPGIGYWLPVIGDAPVDFTFTHQWDAADNLAKKMLDGVAQDKGGELGSLAWKGAQHNLGGSVYGSGCTVFNSSAAPTISVASKLFSTGGTNLIDMLENLRNDTHARLGGGGGFGFKGGTLATPGWWTINVISFATGGSGGVNVARMQDMICTGLKVTMYSPWLGKEPSLMEMRIDFQHAYPGLAESMKFG